MSPSTLFVTLTISNFTRECQPLLTKQLEQPCWKSCLTELSTKKEKEGEKALLSPALNTLICTAIYSTMKVKEEKGNVFYTVHTPGSKQFLVGLSKLCPVWARKVKNKEKSCDF